MVLCAKCGSASQENTSLSFHKFPRPSVHRYLRTKVWAVYCFPDEDWTELQSLYKLSESNKTLCSKHFDDSSYIYYTGERKWLSRYAIPTEARGILAELRNQLNQRNYEALNDDSKKNSADVDAEVNSGPSNALDPMESADDRIADDDDHADPSDTNVRIQALNDDSKNSADVDAEVNSGPSNALDPMESADDRIADDDDHADPSDTNVRIQEYKEPRNDFQSGKIKEYKSIIERKYQKIQRLQAQINQYQRRIIELEEAPEVKKQKGNINCENIGFDDLCEEPIYYND